MLNDSIQYNAVSYVVQASAAASASCRMGAFTRGDGE